MTQLDLFLHGILWSAVAVKASTESWATTHDACRSDTVAVLSQIGVAMGLHDDGGFYYLVECLAPRLRK